MKTLNKIVNTECSVKLVRPKVFFNFNFNAKSKKPLNSTSRKIFRQTLRRFYVVQKCLFCKIYEN